MDRKTIMLGVVGDSASGKTTLTKGLVQLLGEDRVTAICSDDYHRYNRKQRKEMGISALDPRCNYIDIMEQHFVLLRRGQPILKPVYNHSTGDFDPPEYVKPKEFVIVEGLLGFHTRIMRNCFDIKVYLDPPEPLRYEWKIKRDTSKRGYTREQVLEALEKRKYDSPKFIQPQRAMADLVVRFEPPEDNAGETGAHLNARLALRPTVPHPDLGDVLHLAASNGLQPPPLRMRLDRHEGKPVDILEVDGNITEAKTLELKNMIWQHLLPQEGYEAPTNIGSYQNGTRAKQSYPLALTQMLIAYHMIQAREAMLKNERERGRNVQF